MTVETPILQHTPEWRCGFAGNESLTAGAGQLILCGIRATFTLWLCRAAAGSGRVQTGGV
jgi:hypothetical protein